MCVSVPETEIHLMCPSCLWLSQVWWCVSGMFLSDVPLAKAWQKGWVVSLDMIHTNTNILTCDISPHSDQVVGDTMDWHLSFCTSVCWLCIYHLPVFIKHALSWWSVSSLCAVESLIRMCLEAASVDWWQKRSIMPSSDTNLECLQLYALNQESAGFSSL